MKMANPDNTQLPSYFHTDYSSSGINPTESIPPPPAPNKGDAPPPYPGVSGPMGPTQYNQQPQPVLMQNVPPPTMVMTNPTGPRYTCGHCNQIFSYPCLNGYVRCPHCRKTNSVGNWARTRGLIYLIVGIIFLLAGIGVTIGTIEMGGGVYFVWIGAFVVAIIFIIRAIMLFTILKQATPV